ncbi:hypothetical protein [Halorussus marinus]|uniref:hypothetical protein n=1 Tax=Halorussus marinus TaxID=2505976 RepID=UPI001092EC3B|nr:hypothetical protein [Halorussus marinus]
MAEADRDSLTEISDTIDRPDRGTLRAALFALKRWLLLDANRWTVVGLLTGSVFVLTVLVGTFGPVSAQRFLARGTSPGSVLVELMKTIVSVVTIVLSINQLALSPELGPVGDQRERLADTMELRRDSEDLLDRPTSPLAPGQYLDDLVSALREQGVELAASVDGSPELQSELASFARELAAEADGVNDELAEATFGEFEAVAAVMDLDTSGKIERLRRVRIEYDDKLGDDERAAIEEMVDTIELFVTARGFLKTTYVRTEYINFSRALLYVGLPTLFVTYLATQIYDPGVFPGATLGVENRLWFVAAATTVSLIPFATLVSYVGRLATVSQSTLFMGPFVAGAERDGD